VDKITPLFIYLFAGQNSVVAIKTHYKLDGQERESRGGGKGRFSAPVQTGPMVHPASYTKATGSLFLE
jgi:hypothetical protein